MAQIKLFERGVANVEQFEGAVLAQVDGCYGIPVEIEIF